MSKSGSRGWLLQRVTGALLFFTLGTHFYIYHFFMGPGMWGFDSIGYGANDLATLKAMAEATPELAKFYSLSALFANPVWKAFDVLFISLATYHGFYGIRTIVDDVSTAQWARVWGGWLINAFALILWAIGVVSVISFNPQLF